MSLSPETRELGWVHRYPDLFDDLTDAQARAVHNSVANAVLEGWHPTRDDIARQCDVAAGRLSVDDLVAAAQARAHGPLSEDVRG